MPIQHLLVKSGHCGTIVHLHAWSVGPWQQSAAMSSSFAAARHRWGIAAQHPCQLGIVNFMAASCLGVPCTGMGVCVWVFVHLCGTNVMHTWYTAQTIGLQVALCTVCVAGALKPHPLFKKKNAKERYTYTTKYIAVLRIHLTLRRLLCTIARCCFCCFPCNSLQIWKMRLRPLFGSTRLARRWVYSHRPDVNFWLISPAST